MKWLIFASVAMVATVILGSRGMNGTPTPSSRTCTVAGVRWFEGIAQAKQVAAERRKPILLLQMFGSLDDAFC
jgi:hypothetical protein